MYKLKRKGIKGIVFGLTMSTILSSINVSHVNANELHEMEQTSYVTENYSTFPFPLIWSWRVGEHEIELRTDGFRVTICVDGIVKRTKTICYESFSELERIGYSWSEGGHDFLLIVDRDTWKLCIDECEFLLQDGQVYYDETQLYTDVFGQRYNGWTVYDEDGEIWKEAYAPHYINQEYSKVCYENGLKTNELYFLRIDGIVYLATCLVDRDELNIISKYYAVDTGEFLGQTIKVNEYSRAMTQAKELYEYAYIRSNKDDPDDLKTVDKIQQIAVTKEMEKRRKQLTIDNRLYDQNYFKGEYGLGKNLPWAAVISLADIFGSKRLSKEQIDTMLNNPIYMASFIDNYEYPNYFLQEESYYTVGEFYSNIRKSWSDMLDPSRFFALGVIGANEIYAQVDIGYRKEMNTINRQIQYGTDHNYLSKFIFKTNEYDYLNGYFSGYLASTNSADSGYNYVYDLETSKIINLSNYDYKLDKIKSYSTGCTISEIRKEMSCLGINNNYTIDQLMVLGTKNLNDDNVFENYYIVHRDNIDDIKFKKEKLRFSSILESGKNTITGSYSSLNLTIKMDYNNYETTTNNYQLMTLKECLNYNNMSFFVKDTYSEKELLMILDKIRSNDLKMDSNAIKSEAAKIVETVKLEDIVVVDTTTYEEEFPSLSNENTLIKNTDKKYIVLIPLELNINNPLNLDYRSTWDGSMSAVIMQCGIRIDTLSEIIYLVGSSENIQCTSTLEDLLNKLDHSELIADEYALEELGEIQEILNSKNKIYKK